NEFFPAFVHEANTGEHVISRKEQRRERMLITRQILFLRFGGEMSIEGEKVKAGVARSGKREGGRRLTMMYELRCEFQQRFTRFTRGFMLSRTDDAPAIAEIQAHRTVYDGDQ